MWYIYEDDKKGKKIKKNLKTDLQLQYTSLKASLEKEKEK